MQASEFVKKFGIDHTKYLIEGSELIEFAIHSTCAGKYHMDTVSVDDLKRLVESYEVVESLGGLDEAKKRLQQANEEFSILISFKNKSGAICSVYNHVLTKAIADVESCQ